MKKIKFSLFVLSLLLMFVLVGCGSNEFTITFQYEDGTLIEEKVVQKGEEVELQNLEKEGHTFLGWYNGEQKVESPAKFSKKATLVAKFSVNQYTYKFIVNNEVVKEVTANYGSTIEYPSNPEIESTDEFSYVFVGWDNEETVLKENEVFNAIISSTKNSYTYRFIVKGEVIKEETVQYGSEIEYPENPEDIVTPEFTYKFTGWDKDATILNSNIDFTAEFEENKNSYKYTFLDEDGTIIKEATAMYGEEIEYPENPENIVTPEFTYEFTGWDNDATVLQQEEIFVAQYSATKNKYLIKFLNEDNTEISSSEVEYGAMPTIPADVKKPGDTNNEYKFIGWDKEVTVVTKAETYIAVFRGKITSLEGLKLSILGDSISTFYAAGSEMNSYYSGENQFYYPRYSATVKTVDLTWWYQFLKATKMELGINNSWSGSCAVGSGTSAGNSDARLNTLDENGNPDVVIIYLGTNDCASGFETSAFSEALVQIINKIKAKYSSEIFITTLGYTKYTGMQYTEERRLEYNEEIRRLANEYECGVVPLDEYIINDNYMIYLGDNLHYNAKGAALLSKIYEKSIKEYFGIAFDEEIEVEHKELLPEGVLGKVTATASSGFWTGYETNVYLSPKASATYAQFSYRLEITKHENGNYYVTRISKSGDTITFEGDYILIISDAHKDQKALLADLENVVVGSIVEFDESLAFPVTLTFKEGDGNQPTGPTEPFEPEEKPEEVEGQLYVGALNQGVWTLYESYALAYSYDKIDKASTFINFNIISLTKNDNDDNYTITGLKPVNTPSTFDECDYYILIFMSLEDCSYYTNAKIGGTVVVNGDINSGKFHLEFK